MEKTNTTSAYALQVQNEVLLSLEKHPKSIKQLSKDLDKPYPTVRLALRTLEEANEVVPANRANRNALYKLSDGEMVAHKIMPLISIGGEQYKVNELLGLRHQGEMAAETAVKSLPMHVTRLLKTAERLHKGDKTAAVSLVRLRQDMEKDRKAIQNALEAYNEVIRNGKCWSPELLSRFPLDSEWDQADLEDAEAHYKI